MYYYLIRWDRRQDKKIFLSSSEMGKPCFLPPPASQPCPSQEVNPASTIFLKLFHGFKKHKSQRETGQKCTLLTMCSACPFSAKMDKPIVAGTVHCLQFTRMRRLPFFLRQLNDLLCITKQLIQENQMEKMET